MSPSRKRRLVNASNGHSAAPDSGNAMREGMCLMALRIASLAGSTRTRGAAVALRMVSCRSLTCSLVGIFKLLLSFGCEHVLAFDLKPLRHFRLGLARLDAGLQLDLQQIVGDDRDVAGPI